MNGEFEKAYKPVLSLYLLPDNQKSLQTYYERKKPILMQRRNIVQDSYDFTVIEDP